MEKWAVAGILAMLFSCGIAILHRKPFVAHMDKVLETFVLLCAIEMGVVAMQLLKILPSYHPFFRFTGTFRNPSVFAMMMALCLPICVFYTVKPLGRNKSLWQFLSICVTLCIFLSESRTCMIAGACSSLAIVFMEVPRFRTCLSNWKVWLPAILFCIILLAALYVYKRDSADGRTLIWTVSLKMLAEKPLAGWGADGFSSSYMPSQAAFLLEHDGTKFSYLADNVSHPFNEFLLCGVKYGVIGLVILSSVISCFINAVIKTRNVYTSLYIAVLLTLFVLSMFSYPYTVPMIWLVSTYLVCSVIGTYCIGAHKRNIPMLLLLTFPAIWLLYQNRHIYDECQWQRLQISSAPVESVHQEYSDLYNRLSKNPSFLYNYGAWLHRNAFHDESLQVLLECAKNYDDYNVEMLIADNYRQLGDNAKAIETFEYANAMVPCRFLPLYHKMTTYEDIGDYDNACRIAQIIIDKPAKIERSPTVRKIKHEAEKLLYGHL